MNSLYDQLARGPFKVAILERVYLERRADNEFVPQLCSAFLQLDPELTWQVAWLLMRCARDDRLNEDEQAQIAEVLDEARDWVSRLCFCQLFATTGFPKQAVDAVVPFLQHCFSDRRVIIRAWAVSALAPLRRDRMHGAVVRKLMIEAQRDPAKSMQARLRRLKAEGKL